MASETIPFMTNLENTYMPGSVGFMHGLLNCIDTKAKFWLVKKITCKVTMRQVFIRVYGLEIHSVMLVFLTQLCELLPL
jgi:hypothetical protein